MNRHKISAVRPGCADCSAPVEPPEHEI